MTCAELIEALKKQPPDRMVVCTLSACHGLVTTPSRNDPGYVCNAGTDRKPDWRECDRSDKGAVEALFLC